MYRTVFQTHTYGVPGTRNGVYFKVPSLDLHDEHLYPWNFANKVHISRSGNESRSDILHYGTIIRNWMQVVCSALLINTVSTVGAQEYQCIVLKHQRH